MCYIRMLLGIVLLTTTSQTVLADQVKPRCVGEGGSFSIKINLGKGGVTLFQDTAPNSPWPPIGSVPGREAADGSFAAQITHDVIAWMWERGDNWTLDRNTGVLHRISPNQYGTYQCQIANQGNQKF